MPYLKPIKGHTSCVNVKRYLEKNDRALATDFIGLVDIDSDGRNWAEQMDFSRAILGTDIPHKSKKVRTYNHYVLSPDPRDNLTLEQLREFTMDFLDRAFDNKFEIAVVYHDDNENGVIHAHFIVNNPNLEDGGRLSSWLTRAKVQEISQKCQDLAAEYGYRNFLDRPDEDAKRIAADELGILDVEDIPKNEFHGISGIGRSRSFITNQDNFYTKTERELLQNGGYSWKEDIRSRIRIARELSTTEKGFLQALDMLDVGCTVTKRGDYQYSLTDTPDNKVVGYRLGRSFSRSGIRSRLIDETHRKIAKPDSMESARLMAAFDHFRIVGLSTIGYLDPKSGLTLSDIARSLETISHNNIRHSSGFESAIKNASTDIERNEIVFAQKVMREIGRFEPVQVRTSNLRHPETSIESLSPEDAAKLIKQARDERLDKNASRIAAKRSEESSKQKQDEKPSGKLDSAQKNKDKHRQDGRTR